MKTIEQKILKSGIFKLDNKSKPMGIINFTSKKTLSTRVNNYLPYTSHFLQSMILELSDVIKQYLHSDKESIFEKGSVYFEKEIVSLLGSWGISPGDLKPQYDVFIKKAKKHLHKNLSAGTKPFTRRDTKGTYRRDYLISRMHKTFKEHTDINQTNIIHYLAYFLIACGVEKDSPKTVFTRIEQAFYRYQDRHNSYEYVVSE